MRNETNQSKQRGMALFVSLIMLVIMTVIIVHGARSSNLDLMMGNNAQNSAAALMQAEDSVVTAENLIEVNYPGAPAVDFENTNDDGVHLDGDIDVYSVDWSELSPEQSGSGSYYREYIIEYMGPATVTGGSMSVGAGAASDVRYLYRVSGRGESDRGSARVVQTVYATAE